MEKNSGSSSLHLYIHAHCDYGPVAESAVEVVLVHGGGVDVPVLGLEVQLGRVFYDHFYLAGHTGK